ncbi:EAL domain-containing protein [Methylophaga sp.]|uniref:EAL domain-containing protein n=1 Tax=Methylophaga sp. TaxID=2024840 RepID=UPI00235642F0|nr:EAL domain-containing protein [Methylophaga sp.]
MYLANNLGLMTIAEGVENEQQLEFLRMQGCNEVQGYFFSPPTTADEIERMTSWGKDV